MSDLKVQGLRRADRAVRVGTGGADAAHAEGSPSWGRSDLHCQGCLRGLPSLSDKDLVMRGQRDLSQRQPLAQELVTCSCAGIDMACWGSASHVGSGSCSTAQASGARTVNSYTPGSRALPGMRCSALSPSRSEPQPPVPARATQLHAKDAAALESARARTALSEKLRPAATLAAPLMLTCRVGGAVVVGPAGRRLAAAVAAGVLGVGADAVVEAGEVTAGAGEVAPEAGVSEAGVGRLEGTGGVSVGRGAGVVAASVSAAVVSKVAVVAGCAVVVDDGVDGCAVVVC